jgi:hypothetical protein
MSIETKFGTVLGLVIVVLFAVLNAAPATKLNSEPTNTNGGAPPRINLTAPN